LTGNYLEQIGNISEELDVKRWTCVKTNLIFFIVNLFVMSSCSPFGEKSLVEQMTISPKMSFSSSIQNLNFKTNSTIEVELADVEGVSSVEYRFRDSNQILSHSVNNSLSSTWQSVQLVGNKVTVSTPPNDLANGVLQIRLITVTSDNYVINSPVLEIDGTPPAAPALNLVSSSLTSQTTVLAGITSCADTVKVFKAAVSQTPVGSESTWLNCSTTASYSQTISGDGSHDVYFWSIDMAGNVSSQSAVVNVVLDTTSPVVSSTAFSVNEFLAGGSTKTITWSASDLHLSVLPISMDLSLDDGATWSMLSAVMSNSGSYSWAVPMVDSSLMRVRIKATDVLGNSTSIVSARFIVDSTNPAISLSSPNGGEFFKAGNSHTVSWTSADTNISASSTLLEYSVNNGTSWTTIAASQATTGSYSWTLPAVDSTQVLVRATVSDLTGHVSSDSSNGVFAIDKTSPALNLTSLTGSEILAAGQIAAITWTLSDNIALALLPVNLDYSLDSGATWSTMASALANSGSYNWTTPNVNSNNVRVRISAADVVGNIASATSVSDFSIDNSAPVIAISAPTGSEIFAGGSSQNISWSTSGDHLVSASVSIELSTGGSWSSVAVSQSTTGSYSWSVPSLNTGSALLRISVLDLAGHAVTQTMSSSFVIDSTTPALSVTEPTQNTVYKGGSSLAILWSASDLNFLASPMALQYSVNNGSSWTNITLASSNTGTYNWTLPVTDTVSAQIRVTATDIVGHVASQTVANFAIDSTAPTSLMITGMVSGPTSQTASRSLTMSGTDVSHYKGFLKFGSTCAGELAQTQSQIEKSVAVSHTISFASGDGNYIYCALGRDVVGNEQTFVTASPVMILDTVAPALTVSSPVANFRAKTKVVLEGDCEVGFPVKVSGTGVLSAIDLICTAGAYSSDVFFSATDGNKSITVRQTDLAGNIAEITRIFVRDNVAPSIAQTTLSNPFYSNTNTITWGGTCEANLPLKVELSGGDLQNFNCSSGTWSYATQAQTTDNSRTYVLTQTDEAGNAASINMVWVRDVVPPQLDFTSSDNITSTLNSVTFQGQCDGVGPITVSGAQTSSVTCTAGNWTFNSNNFIIDGTYTFNFQVQDLAGNITAIVGTWIRDTSAPALSITGSSQVLDQNNSVTFAGACQADINDVYVTQPVSSTLTCVSGAWTYTYNNNVDGAYNFSFYQQNVLATRTTVNAIWTRDTIAPVLADGFFNINSGTATTTLRYVKVDLRAVDQTSRVNAICMKSDDDTRPGLNAGCWISSFTASKTVTLNQVDMGLGLADKNYTLYAWAKDEAGNISDLTGAGAGTDGKDKKSIILNAGLPPALSIVAAGVNAPQTPLLLSESAVTAGSSLYINWKVTDDRALPAQYITLEFTTDNSGNYDEIAANLGSLAYNSCTVQPGFSGCYKWTSPTNGFLKIRGKVTDSDNQVAFGISSPLNVGQLRLLAGKTDPGTNQSARVNKFQPYNGDVNWTDQGSFVVTRDGVIYVRDSRRGILKIDPIDGIARVFIAKTGASTGDNGSASSAGVNHPGRLLLDKSQPKQKLYIYDYDRIRVVDLNTNMITRVVGGGATHATNTLATDFQIRAQDPFTGWHVTTMGNSTFMVMPNGDILFQEAFHRLTRSDTQFAEANSGSSLWWYKKSDNRVYKYLVNGTGVMLDNLSTPQVFRPAQDISKCGQYTFWPDIQSDGTFNRFGLTTHTTSEENGDVFWADCRMSGRERWRWQDTPHFADLSGNKIDDYWSSSGFNFDGGNYKIYHHLQPLLGLDNKVYILNVHEASSAQGLYQYDRATKNYVQVVGGGYRGHCLDGTQALSCNDTYSSAFVNETGQIYFMTRGLIRTLKADGTVVTVAGTSSADVDGPALDSFIGYVLHFHVRSNGLIMYADQNDYQFREVDPAKSVKTIVDGSFNWAHNSGARFALDAATGDIYHHNGGWQVARYTRNSATFGASGTWSQWSGGGSIGYDDPAAENSSNIDFIANGSSNTGPGSGTWTNWGAWIPPYPLLHDGQNLLVWTSKHIAEVNASGTNITGNIPYRSSLLSFDVTTKAMRRIAGRLDSFGHDVMETGASANQLQILGSEWGHRMLGPYYNASGGPRRYFTSRIEWNNVYEITDGGGTRVLTTTANRLSAISYRKIGADDFIYYCGHDTGQVYKRNVTTGVETQFTSNVPNFRCTGYGMQWSDFSQSIIFPYEIDGYQGIAEFVDP
jgi:hypothetical protein